MNDILLILLIEKSLYILLKYCKLINKSEFGLILPDFYTFELEISGKFDENSYTTDLILKFREGVQMVIEKNGKYSCIVYLESRVIY